MGTTAPTTKTQAKATARRARQYGHFDVPASIGRPRTLWVKCPVCGQKVETEYSLYAGTVTQQLDAGMAHHLDGYCEPR